MADRAARERAVREATQRVRQGSVWTSRASSSGRFVTKKPSSIERDLTTLERCADAIDADGGDCSISIAIRESASSLRARLRSVQMQCTTIVEAEAKLPNDPSS